MISEQLRYTIIFSITCLTFYAEALTHYNIGKFGKIGFRIPPIKENILIIVTIGMASFTSSLLIFIAEKLLDSFN